MRLGFLTAPFPETPLMDVADWTAAQRLREPRDRLLAAVDRARPAAMPAPPTSTSRTSRRARRREIVDEIAAKGLSISGLGYYPNPLHPDPAHREMVIGHLKHVITAAEKMGVPFVNTFMGARRARRHQDENWEEALGSGRTSSRSRNDHGRKITIENCPMLFSDDEWPGGTTSRRRPGIWRRILEQWGGTIGLNFDPSHLILQMIDIPRFIREFGPHILHFQAKDLMIDRDGLYERGIFSIGHRLADPAPARPGRRRLGRRSSRPCSAPATTATASSSTRTGDFEKTDELIKRGFLLARDILRPYIK